MEIDSGEVIAVLLSEYTRWKEGDSPTNETDLIAVGAVGAISNIICRVSEISSREYQYQCDQRKRNAKRQ